jgi:hypothetical protein
MIIHVEHRFQLDISTRVVGWNTVYHLLHEITCIFLNAYIYLQIKFLMKTSTSNHQLYSKSAPLYTCQQSVPTL